MNLNNPGWFNRLLKVLKRSKFSEFTHKTHFYEFHRSTGFTYGNCSHINLFHHGIEAVKYNEKEKLRFCYIASFYHIFILFGHSTHDFTELLSLFYKQQFHYDINEKRDLEFFINKRLSRQSNRKIQLWEKLVPNSLLYCDIFAWKRHLQNQFNPEFLFNYQNMILKNLDAFFHSNNDLQKKEIRYLQNFKSSSDISDSTPKNEIDENKLSITEKKYIIEILTISAWIDGKFTDKEQEIIRNVQQDYNLESQELEDSLTFVENFIQQSKSDDLFLLSKNKFALIQKKIVKQLNFQLKNNRDKIVQEISESKELITLLAKASKEKLSEEEQKKVKTQLIDILKVIPSIAIFLLPAGTLIFPLIIKIIPKKILFPTSFLDNDNLEDLD